VDEIQVLLDQIIAENAGDKHNEQTECEPEEESQPGDAVVPEQESEDDSTRDSESEACTDEDVDEQVNTLSAALLEVLDRSEVLFQYAHGFSTMVLRVTDNVVAKLIRDVDNTTEYSSLVYLQDHAPNIPAPRPRGLLKIGRYLVMFSTYLPGEDLDKVWPRLEDSAKRDISS
jgi:hypothetical protein